MILLLLSFSLISLANEQHSSMDKNELSEKMKTPEIMEQNKLQIAHVLRDRASTTRISNLYIKKNKLPVALITKGDKLRPMVELVFFYDRPSWILRTSENDPLIPGVDSRELRLPVYLKEKVQLITLKAMGPISETEIETFYVYSPEAQELKFESSWDQLILSIGAASFNYFQTHYGYYKSYTGYFSMRRAPSFDKTEKWGLLAEVQATTLTFWASPIQSGPQIIQGKGDILIWLSPQEVQQWRAQYYVGMNYLTMLANNSPFGFSNLFSPDIGGRHYYIKNYTDSWIFEWHYSPINEKSVNDFGIDLKAYWNRLLPNTHRMEVGFGLSRFNYSPDPQRLITTQLISITMGYSL